MNIPAERSLTPAETALIQWLLQHGVAKASDYLTQLDRCRVVSRCSCGCASINFAVDGVSPSPQVGMGILADYEWKATGGEMFGVFVFERSGLLAGLEVWSQDGQATAAVLPEINRLRPMSMENHNRAEML